MSESDIRLGVNLDHVAAIRQARGTPYPDIGDAIRAAETAGADGITLHLREDRRHIQPEDVRLARRIVTTTFNLEMAATPEMIAFAQEIGPEYCCIVPERREELTTEGGLDVLRHKQKLAALCEKLGEREIKVSLFIEPDIETVEAALDIGAPLIELHTGHYANAAADTRNFELARIARAADHAKRKGLQVNAGHGLDYVNVEAVAAVSVISELNIGHAIVARALFGGLEQAVKTMKTIIHKSRAA